jgi:formylglycine-generating enzyme required for sulfatase activity
MIGNTREWTLSLWGERRSAPDPQLAYPWQPDARNDPNANPMLRRVFRGGMSTLPAGLTAAARGSVLPTDTGSRETRIGFRIVMS